MKERVEISYITLDKRAFDFVMKAIGVKVPFKCDCCGIDVTKDNFGFIHADYKTCKSTFCLIHAVNEVEDNKGIKNAKRKK